MLPRPFIVQRTKRETADTFTLELNSVDGAGLQFSAGQFNMLYVFGAGEAPISISGDPARPGTLVHTTRAVGVVTNAMSRLKRGNAIGVRGPYGMHWPVDEAAGSDVLIIAGGIGLAPLRPAVYDLVAHRERYGKVVILYGTRRPEEILYRKELEEWRARFDLEVHVTVDRSSGKWRGNVGVVTKLISRAPFDPANAVAMVCGPEIMMRFAVSELVKRGLKADDIYLSMERNMKCGIGLCGHCQWGPTFVCKDGPVYPYSRIREVLSRREV